MEKVRPGAVDPFHDNRVMSRIANLGSLQLTLVADGANTKMSRGHAGLNWPTFRMKGMLTTQGPAVLVSRQYERLSETRTTPRKGNTIVLRL